jgi:quercetin dioxygenase-like cupin family protein
MQRRSALMGALALLMAPLAGLPARSTAAAMAPTFADLKGEVVLDNSRVLVQRFAIQPGQSTGLHTHPSNQLLVFIKGGVLRSESGRSTRATSARIPSI